MAKKFFGDVELKSSLKLSNYTTERALVVDASGDLVVSAVTSTELGNISGLSSNVQTQLDAKIDSSEKGANNGVATLGASGKIPQSQIPAIAITEVFVVADISARDALTVGSGDGEIQEGDVVVVTDASADAQVSSGAASYIYDGSGYQRLLNPDAPVDSVNGQSGTVVLDSDDISEGSTNLYYTEARFDTSLSGKDSDDISEGSTNLYYTEARFDASLLGKSTSDLSEGSNLYYTDTRFDTRFNTKDADDLNYEQTTPADWTVATNSTLEATLDEVGGRLTTLEGGSTDTKQILISANDTTEGYLEDKVVVSAGVNSSAILEVSTLNDGGDEDLQIQIDEARIDHDALLNFVANEHIDWTTDAGQDVADANISETSVTQHQAALSVTASQVSDFDTEVSNNTDVAANTAARHDAVTLAAGVTSQALSLSGQEITSAPASSSTAGHMSASDKTKLDSLSGGSAGDISETAFAGSESASSVAVTNFAFSGAVVRSFRALVHVEVDATADLFEVVYIEGIQKSGDWEISVSSTGDDTLVTFDINASGQINYSSSTYAGFSSMDITFRAITTSV